MTETQDTDYEAFLKSYISMSKEDLMNQKKEFQKKVRQFRKKIYMMKIKIKYHGGQQEKRDTYIKEHYDEYKLNQRKLAATWEALREKQFVTTPRPPRRPKPSLLNSNPPEPKNKRMTADINLMSKMPSYLMPFKN